MNYNKSCFRSHRSSNPLLVSYCCLVESELELKQMLGGNAGNHGHNILRLVHMAGARGFINKGKAAAIKSNLEMVLSGLWCESKGGGPKKVPAENYPYIRYLRHDSDWMSDCSSDEDLEDLKKAAERFRLSVVRK